MTLDSLVDIFKEVIEGLDYSIDFTHGRRDEVNSYVEKNPSYPLVYLFTNEATSVNNYVVNRNFSVNTWTVNFALYLQYEIDASKERKNEIQKESDKLLNEILYKINDYQIDRGELTVGNVDLSPVYYYGATRLAGRGAIIRISSPDNISVC